MTTHIVLCDFGKLGLEGLWHPECADFKTVIADLVCGEYDTPVQVIAFDVQEGWSRDVSEDVARAVLQHFADFGGEPHWGLRRFLDNQVGAEAV